MTRLRICCISFLGCIAVQPAFAANENLVREYVKKSGFRIEMEQAVRQVSPSLSKNDQFKKFAGNINYSAIEDSYVRALVGKLSDDEVRSLIKSLEIPGLHEALKKQAQAAAGIYEVIVKEIETAAGKSGLSNKGR